AYQLPPSTVRPWYANLPGRCWPVLALDRHRGAEQCHGPEVQTLVVGGEHYGQQITHKLVDFSRIGETVRISTNLRVLVEEVLEMLGHLGRGRLTACKG